MKQENMVFLEVPILTKHTLAIDMIVVVVNIQIK